MEEVTWIEVLSRKRQVVSRQRAIASTVTIGRAYDNDLILDDPHMAAHHMRLARARRVRIVVASIEPLS